MDPRFEPQAIPTATRELNELLAQLAELQNLREQHSQMMRPGLKDGCAQSFEQRYKALADFVAECDNTPCDHKLMVSLNLFLWDGYSAPNLKIELCHDAGLWTTVMEGCYKPLDLLAGQYGSRQRVQWEGGPPTRLRATVEGFGGQGIAFATVLFRDDRYIPDCVLATDGLVRDPQHLLHDDSHVAFMGNTNTAEAVIDRSKKYPGQIEIALRRI